MKANKLFMFKIIIQTTCGNHGPTHFAKTRLPFESNVITISQMVLIKVKFEGESMLKMFCSKYNVKTYEIQKTTCNEKYRH